MSIFAHCLMQVRPPVAVRASKKSDGRVDHQQNRTEVGVISLDGIVYKGSVRVGDDSLTNGSSSISAATTVHRRTNAEVVKEIGSAFPGSEVKEIEVGRRNMSEGIPRSGQI
ncbi:rod shape-determining protein [Caballeronia humi]|uniref:rod shape-determining protein n=1 Tax=Caballeronia humi TaxID=326474 RepID=UPI0035B56774